MRRSAGTAAFLLPLIALAVGPWLGIPGDRSAPMASSTRAFWDGEVEPFLPFAPRRQVASEPAAPGRTVCNCRTVDVNLRNDVRDVKIKTGKASVSNLAITYVSSDYGDREVDINQEAEAVSGDAIAGQLVGVDARGPGCVNVRVNATNRVQNATLETGDATASNRSVVLLDPGVSRGDLEIDVEQEATARSGDAIAGQVLGVIGGNSVGGCGGRVDLTAVNEVLDTKVKTGKAAFLNDVEIRRCAKVGCAEEFRELTGEAEIEVCSGRRCREVERGELAAALADAAGRHDDGVETSDQDDEIQPIEQAPCRAGKHKAQPTPTPTPGPADEPTPDTDAAPAAATPSPSPSPSPNDECAEPSPSPDSDSELMATGDSAAGS